MKTRYYLFTTMSFVAAWADPLSAQTVSLSLSSPQNGVTVAPGTPIEWSIAFNVSSNDNVGLALLIVDLAQAPTNPAKLDLPPADAVPPPMANFSRPAGISNPGETNPVTGYIGVQRGAAGEKNLRQIGGAQNTFGQARPPGSGIAETATVAGGIGQHGSTMLASGSFTAPTTPGNYTFQLENAVASVLAAVNPLPQHSPVSGATVIVTSPSISLIVSGTPCEACDVNCDGASDGRDVQSFITTLMPSPPVGCSPCAGDVNGSGGVSVDDIGPFVTCLLGA